jgi:hypothetical protein
VRPEEGAPEISVNVPFGKPPASASTERIPVETVSGVMRSGNSEAGIIRPAKLPRLLRMERSRSAGESATIETGTEKATGSVKEHLKGGNSGEGSTIRSG